MLARVLILGGTSEGFTIARALSTTGQFDVVTSMAGRTPAPKQPAGKVRRGGFGGVAGLSSYLTRNNIAAVVDATHPFAHQISQNATQAGQACDVPVVHIHREGWQQRDGDKWIEVGSSAEAATTIPANARGVFLTTGKTTLKDFAERRDVHFLARIVAPILKCDDVGLLPRHISFIHKRGPFDVARERGLLIDRRVSLVVSKNSGGSGAQAKLDAARELGLSVIMIQRPPPPTGLIVANATEALDWLHRTLNLPELMISDKRLAVTD